MCSNPTTDDQQQPSEGRPCVARGIRLPTLRAFASKSPCTYSDRSNIVISPLCLFSSLFPGIVGSELDDAKGVSHQARETSYTDRMLLEFKKLRNPRIIVQGSNEPLTGADMDWIFVRWDKRRHLQLAVQAKILHYTRPRTPPRYDELAYPPQAPGGQARTLTRYAKKQCAAGRAVYPLYLFYNPASLAVSSVWPGDEGVTLANGYAISRHVERNRTGPKIANGALDLSAIQPMTFSLPSIFCRPSHLIPEPDMVADAINQASAAAQRRSDAKIGAPSCRADGRVPDDIARLLHRTVASSLAEDVDGAVIDRPRVLFVSGWEDA